MDETIIHFVDKYIQTDATLHLVYLCVVQTHKHTKTCTKRRKKCRFGFPRASMPYTMLLCPITNCPLPNKTKNHIKEALENEVPLEVPFPSWLEALGISFPRYVLYLRTTIDDTTFFLKRAPRNTYTNNFNPTLSEL